jgi:hypothetical protein
MALSLPTSSSTMSRLLPPLVDMLVNPVEKGLV